MSSVAVHRLLSTKPTDVFWFALMSDVTLYMFTVQLSHFVALFTVCLLCK